MFLLEGAETVNRAGPCTHFWTISDPENGLGDLEKLKHLRQLEKGAKIENFETLDTTGCLAAVRRLANLPHLEKIHLIAQL